MHKDDSSILLFRFFYIDFLHCFKLTLKILICRHGSFSFRFSVLMLRKNICSENSIHFLQQGEPGPRDIIVISQEVIHDIKFVAG